MRSDYRTAADGRYVERQIALLRHAIAIDEWLFSEIAKMTLGWWKRINPGHLVASIGAVAGYGEDHLTRLIALLGMGFRYDERRLAGCPALSALVRLLRVDLPALHIPAKRHQICGRCQPFIAIRYFCL